MKYDDVVLGLIFLSFLFFLTLAFMGSTVSAWWVVLFIVPTFIDAILKRLYDKT